LEKKNILGQKVTGWIDSGGAAKRVTELKVSKFLGKLRHYNQRISIQLRDSGEKRSKKRLLGEVSLGKR